VGIVIDVGVRSRQSVRGPVNLLLQFLRGNAENQIRIFILTDATTPGGNFADFNESYEQLMSKFEAGELCGFQIIAGQGRFICLWPPRFETWRIVGETNENLDEMLLDKLIVLPEIEYAAASQDEMLDIDQLDHVRRDNFPWDDWRLIAARVSS
jgi:hypothetical protein